MPFVLAIFGIIMLVTAIQGTYKDFWSLFVSEFTGDGTFSNSYIYWVASIAIIGGLGYVPQLKKISDMFLFLMLLVFILKNGGVFDKFNSALSQSYISTTPSSTITPGTITWNTPSSSLLNLGT